MHPSSATIANLAREVQHKKSKEMAEFWGLFLLSSSLFWSWSIQWVVWQDAQHQGNIMAMYDVTAINQF
jgi:hypothetical protein